MKLGDRVPESSSPHTQQLAVTHEADGPVPIETLDESSDGELEHKEPIDYYFARFGTFMISTPCTAPAKKALRDSIEAHLKADSRVSRLSEVPFRPDWMFRETMYPRATDESTDEQLITGSDHFHTVRLSDAFTFTVTVPIKNQPLFRGMDDIPTDTYSVAWDGVAAVVLWRATSSHGLPPRSGGHIVIEILQEISEKANFSLYSQPCSPGCTNVFAHRVIKVVRFPGKQHLGKTETRGFPIVTAHFHCDGDELDVAGGLFKSLAQEFRTFAKYKNQCQRLKDVESLARRNTDQLLTLHYDEIKRARQNWHSRIKNLFVYKNERRQARELVAKLWLTLARLEALKRDWLESRHQLMEQIETKHRKCLFQDDFGDDDYSIQSLDLSFVRAAIEQTSSRFDSRTVALATAAGAVAGGLLGALLTGLLAIA